MNDNLLRQRRNLIGMSVALLLLRFPDDSIDKISILGAELKVASAYNLPVFAAVLLGYFLTRYYQYLKAEGNLGISSSVASSYRTKVCQHICRKTGETSVNGEIVFERSGIHWKYHVQDRKTDTGLPLLDTLPEQLPFFQSWLWWLQAYTSLTIRTTKVTDYVIPYLLAAAAAIQLVVGLTH